MIKIVITGPESTGKTTLAQGLGRHYQTDWLREYARIYIDNLHRPYEQEDLLIMAKGQLASEEAARMKGQNLIICDTSLEVIKIWSEVKYHACHPWILDKLQKQKVDVYLLCTPDIPWQPDPQRESPEDRERLFTIYQHELEDKNYIEIRGDETKRLSTAIQAVDTLLK